MSVKKYEFFVDEPWEHGDFQQPPVIHSDHWRKTWWARGWLIREHGYRRARAFQPLHGTLPVDAEDLTGERVTIAFLDEKPNDPYVHHDKWNLVGASPLPFVNKNSHWVGYTLLRRASRPEVTPEPPSSSTAIPTFGRAQSRATAAGSVYLDGSHANLEDGQRVLSSRTTGDGHVIRVKAPPPFLQQTAVVVQDEGDSRVRVSIPSGWSISVDGASIEFTRGGYTASPDEVAAEVPTNVPGPKGAPPPLPRRLRERHGAGDRDGLGAEDQEGLDRWSLGVGECDHSRFDDLTA